MKRNKSGFSMIEVLVASTIMIMIVMMLGMLFQQSSLAWRTGKQRADTYQQVRAIFGSIQRDASAAIDQSTLPQRLFVGDKKLPKIEDQGFNGSTLSFYTLTGTGFDNDQDARSGQAPRRSITLIRYSGYGRRAVTTFLPVAGGGFTLGTSQDGDIVKANLNGANVQLAGFQAFDEKGNSVTGNKFPAYVTIRAEVNSDGVRSFDIGAASSGPDLTLGKNSGDIRSRDDIKTWAD